MARKVVLVLLWFLRCKSIIDVYNIFITALEAS